MKFLLVDNDRAVCALIAQVMRDMGNVEVCDFATADDARAALASLLVDDLPLPDLVMTDINLPGSSGVEFCRWIKMHPQLADVPVVVISGVEGEAVLPDAFAAGAHDFIRKPLVVYELQARLKAAVRLSAAATIRRTATRMAEKELVFSQAMINSISSMDVGLLVIEKGRLTFVNPALCRLTGYSEAELYSWPSFVELIHQDERARILENHRRRLAGEHFGSRYETVLRSKDGERLAVDFSVAFLEKPPHNGVICLVRDIREQLEMQKKLRNMAEYDALTGLPNRRLMQDRLIQALHRSHRSGEDMAVLFIDLDGFKGVNDTHGHAAGDELLRQVAGRLQVGLRASDTAARLAGDEFVVILEPDTHGQLEPVVVAEKMLASLRQTFDLGGTSVQISASIGIVRTHGDPDAADLVLHCADTAMYRAKQAGKNSYWLLNASLEPNSI